MNPNALNCASAATQDDGACTFLNLGCTDSNARNYESAAEAEHYDYAYRCRFITYGCQNEYSWNYNAAATDDDGSCLPLQSSVPLPGKIAAEGFCFEPDCATTPGFGLGASTCAINSVKSLYESMFTTATQTASEYLCSSALPMRDAPHNHGRLVSYRHARIGLLTLLTLSLSTWGGRPRAPPR